MSGQLRNRVLSQHNIRLLTKLRIYNAVVLPSLLHGCESWTLYRWHIKKLEKFHMRALRSSLGIRWQDGVRNLEVLDSAHSTSVESMLLKAQLCWAEMSSGWKSTAYQDACCAESSCKAKDTKAARGHGTRKPSKPAYSGVNSNQRSWRRLPVKDHSGAAELKKLLKALRTLDAKSSLLPEINAIEHLQQLSQPRTSSAPTVPDSASPDWVCRATSEYNVEIQNC